MSSSVTPLGVMARNNCNITLLDRDRVERARTGGERERGASGGAYEYHWTTEVDLKTDGLG
jgi:hypothetical protein